MQNNNSRRSRRRIPHSMLLLCAACMAFSASDSPFLNLARAADAPQHAKERARRGGHDTNDMSSHLFGIEGRLVGARAGGGNLLTMRIRVKKSLPNAVGYDPFERAKGKVVTIRLDESAVDFAGLKFKVGDQMMMWLGFVDSSDGDFGSNASWVAVQRDGRFYRVDGTAVDAAGLFPH